MVSCPIVAAASSISRSIHHDATIATSRDVPTNCVCMRGLERVLIRYRDIAYLVERQRVRLSWWA